MAFDADQFKKTMSQFASGVTVVTANHEGILYGITVSAFSSLSLDPPLVLICIGKKVKSHDGIAQAGHFAVNILGEGQEEISNHFASRVEDKFEGIETTSGSLGDPLIAGSAATMECRMHAQLDGGDHTIFVGEVVESAVTEDWPLLYFRGGYRQLTR